MGVWESGHGSSVDTPYQATFDGGSYLYDVPFDPTIVMVSLVHDESGRNSKHVFRDGLSKTLTVDSSQTMPYFQGQLGLEIRN